MTNIALAPVLSSPVSRALSKLITLVVHPIFVPFTLHTPGAVLAEMQVMVKIIASS
jgi:hypothetical protein